MKTNPCHTMTILFLSAWYPNRYDAMYGLFVRKHAQAVARHDHCTVHVLYICPHPDVTDHHFTDQTIENVHELTYYRPPLTSTADEIRTIRHAWHTWHTRRNTLPDIVHLNIITKLGWLARYLRWKHHIPYIITEHWSGYLPENGDFRGTIRTLSARLIARGASAIMPVSTTLMDAMKTHGLKCRHWQVVNNVIDDFFYRPPTTTRHDHFRFIHVSCFDDKPKNTLGIIEAIHTLATRRTDFEVIMVGTGKDWDKTIAKAEQYGLTTSKIIRFTGEQTPQEVKHLMDQSDCFLLFSNYETAAIVIGEALTCGLPVITTAVGMAPEYITPHRGTLIPRRDIDALTRAMDHMIDHAATYDRDNIRRDSRDFSFDTVGRKIIDIYHQTLKHKRL